MKQYHNWIETGPRGSPYDDWSSHPSERPSWQYHFWWLEYREAMQRNSQKGKFDTGNATEIVQPSGCNKHIRPHLEYNTQAWPPYLNKDIQILKKVQQKEMAKLVYSISKLPYPDKLKQLCLTTFERRRRRGALIETSKIVTRREENVFLNMFGKFSLSVQFQQWLYLKAMDELASWHLAHLTAVYSVQFQSCTQF